MLGSDREALCGRLSRRLMFDLKQPRDAEVSQLCSGLFTVADERYQDVCGLEIAVI